MNILSLPASLHYPKQAFYKSKDYHKLLYHAFISVYPLCSSTSKRCKTTTENNHSPFLYLVYSLLMQDSLKWKELVIFIEIWPSATLKMKWILVCPSKVFDFLQLFWKRLLNHLPRFYAQEHTNHSISQSIKKLTGGLFSSTGIGRGTGMARGLGAVKLNSFGWVTVDILTSVVRLLNLSASCSISCCTLGCHLQNKNKILKLYFIFFYCANLQYSICSWHLCEFCNTLHHC